MLKVVHLTHTDLAFDSRILKEINALTLAGYSVSGIGIQLDERSICNDSERLEDLRTISLQTRRLSVLPKTIRHTLSLCEMLCKMVPYLVRLKPRIIHCHDTMALVAGAVAKPFTGARLIYDAHELESNRNGQSRPQRILTRQLERVLWPLIDALLVVSPSIDSWYQDAFGPKRSAVVLNSPTFSQTSEATATSLREALSVPLNRRIFIYLGLLDVGRGIDVAVEVFKKQCVESELVFIGYGRRLKELQDLAVNTPNIHVLDAVPHEEVVPLIRAADFGLCLIENVSLSDYYSLPNKLFEYAFAGVPVVASRFPDIEVVVQKHSLGICCEPTVSGLAAAVRLVESDQQRFLFQNLEELDWASQSVKIRNLYTEVLGMKSQESY